MQQESPLPAWVFNLRDESLGVRRALAPGVNARVVGGQHVTVSVVRFEPHVKGTMHSHPEEQWGFLLEGECLRLQGEEAVPMKAGAFWHTPGNVPHAIRTGPSGAVVLDIFSPPRQDYTKPGEGFGAARTEPASPA
jgi:quercetin dioxygenase-like cupin family protein